MIDRIIAWLEAYRSWYWHNHYAVMDRICKRFGHRSVRITVQERSWRECKRCGEPLDFSEYRESAQEDV